MFDKENIKPMLLQEISKPFNDDNFLYELKFDGFRVLIYASKDKFIIRSRNNHDITFIYPELKSIKKLVKNKKVIFDGEIVSLDNGYPSFKKLQERSKIKDISKVNEQSLENPVVFIAFDILYENKELINKDLLTRKEILNKYEDTNNFIKSVVYKDGLKLFLQVKKLKLEGIIAKDKNSTYIPNKRVNSWLKIKNFKKASFLIHGYKLNKEKYSLLLSEYQNKKLIYVGKISVTKNNNLIKELQNITKISNKFINYNEEATYIKPIKKVFVKFMERTDNNRLREPFLARD